MYLSIGQPRKAKTIELTGDFLLRLSPQTGQVVGLTIIDFSKHFPYLEIPPKFEKGFSDVEMVVKNIFPEMIRVNAKEYE
jgi:hypothetical protein